MLPFIIITIMLLFLAWAFILIGFVTAAGPIYDKIIYGIDIGIGGIGRMFIGLFVLACGIFCFWASPSKDERDQLFLENKPGCQDESVKCLKEKADWYRDSIKYEVKGTLPDSNLVIDSLKTYLKTFE